MFELPLEIIQELKSGLELGEVIDTLTNQKNSKQKGGAIGYFTQNVMTRQILYESGIIVALVPFLNEKLYFK